MDIIVTALSVVFSGVVATVITILYQKFSGEQTTKRKVFETAVSYRFFISEEENDEMHMFDKNGNCLEQIKE